MQTYFGATILDLRAELRVQKQSIKMETKFQFLNWRNKNNLMLMSQFKCDL